MIVEAGINLVGQVIGLFGAKGKATQEDIKARVANMERSWTDEFIAVYWFGPDIIGWFNPDWALAIKTTQVAEPEVLAIQLAITAAVFGLGKLNGKSK